LLSIRGLKTYFYTFGGIVKAVDGADVDVPKNSIVGLAGESGCGKSMLCMSVLGLVPVPGKIVGGKILWKGRDIVGLNEIEMNKIRGREISMIFQDPSTALNPVFRVGEQAARFVTASTSLARRQAEDRIVDTFRRIDLPDPPKILDKYPHELSGGMLQRIMIGIALSCGSELLIADEPTTSLDVTTQAKILELIKKLQIKESLTVLIVSHNLALLSYLCDYVGVMYCGNLVEYGSIEALLMNPAHPYTVGLMKCIPTPDKTRRLYAIDGNISSLLDSPAGCKFHPRCPKRTKRCTEEMPVLTKTEDGTLVSCFRPGA